MRRAGMDLRRVAAQGASRIRAGFLAGETGVPTALSPSPRYPTTVATYPLLYWIRNLA
jgi:hypothetical protein